MLTNSKEDLVLMIFDRTIRLYSVQMYKQMKLTTGLYEMEEKQ